MFKLLILKLHRLYLLIVVVLFMYDLALLFLIYDIDMHTFIFSVLNFLEKAIVFLILSGNVVLKNRHILLIIDNLFIELAYPFITLLDLFLYAFKILITISDHLITLFYRRVKILSEVLIVIWFLFKHQVYLDLNINETYK